VPSTLNQRNSNNPATIKEVDMGFFSRLFGQDPERSGENRSLVDHRDASESESGIDSRTATAVLDEIDIDTALAAHENWKIRLESVIQGSSTEIFRPEHVCRDDLCDLGKWLHGSGQNRLGKFPAFSLVVARHKHFHLQASTVASLAQAGEPVKAIQLLNGGYQHASTQLAFLLKELKNELVHRQTRRETRKY
jgi:hypothetical protein